jgi:hypothetical protein
MPAPEQHLDVRPGGVDPVAAPHEPVEEQSRSNQQEDKDTDGCVEHGLTHRRE